MAERKELLIQFTTGYNNEIASRAEDLKNVIPDLDVVVFERTPFSRAYALSPIARYQGERSTHEYGDIAVNRLIDDLRTGQLR